MKLSSKGALRLGAGALVAALMCGASTSVLAAEAAAPVTAVTAADIAAMRARLDALEAALDTTNTNVSALTTPTGGVTTATLSNGRPAFASADKRFSAQIRTVMMLDAAHYDQDKAGPLNTDLRRAGAAGDTARAQDLNSGLVFRRARLGVEGKLFNDFDYGFIYEFGGSGTEDGGRIQELWVQTSALRPLRIRFGAFEANTGLAANTSTSGGVMMERPAAAEIARNIAAGDARYGVQVQANGFFGDDASVTTRWMVSGALTGSTVATTQPFDEQFGYVGRVAISPSLANGFVVHMGASANVAVNPQDATGSNTANRYVVQLRDRPELRVDGTRLIDGTSIDSKNVSAYGLELAAQYKRFLVEAEHFDIKIKGFEPIDPSPKFKGYYVQGSWMLTGETRGYDAASGVFSVARPTVNYAYGAGTFGAFELAARYSVMDLNHNEGAPLTAMAAGAIRGGEQTIRSIGLNWYPNPSIRFMLNYQNVEIDRLAPSANFGGGVYPAGSQIGQKYNALAFRTQVAF